MRKRAVQCSFTSDELSLGCKLGVAKCGITDMKWLAAMFYAYLAVYLRPVGLLCKAQTPVNKSLS